MRGGGGGSSPPVCSVCVFWRLFMWQQRQLVGVGLASLSGSAVEVHHIQVLFAGNKSSNRNNGEMKTRNLSVMYPKLM